MPCLKWNDNTWKNAIVILLLLMVFILVVSVISIGSKLESVSSLQLHTNTIISNGFMSANHEEDHNNNKVLSMISNDVQKLPEFVHTLSTEVSVLTSNFGNLPRTLRELSTNMSALSTNFQNMQNVLHTISNNITIFQNVPETLRGLSTDVSSLPTNFQNLENVLRTISDNISHSQTLLLPLTDRIISEEIPKYRNSYEDMGNKDHLLYEIERMKNEWKTGNLSTTVFNGLGVLSMVSYEITESWLEFVYDATHKMWVEHGLPDNDCKCDKFTSEILELLMSSSDLEINEKSVTDLLEKNKIVTVTPETATTTKYDDKNIFKQLQNAIEMWRDHSTHLIRTVFSSPYKKILVDMLGEYGINCTDIILHSGHEDESRYKEIYTSIESELKARLEVNKRTMRLTIRECGK